MSNVNIFLIRHRVSETRIQGGDNLILITWRLKFHKFGSLNFVVCL